MADSDSDEGCDSPESDYEMVEKEEQPDNCMGQSFKKKDMDMCYGATDREKLCSNRRVFCDRLWILGPQHAEQKRVPSSPGQERQFPARF